MAGIEPGLSAEITHVVSGPEAAANWGGDMPVLSTAVLLWLGEVAAGRALDGLLGEGETTLGLAHDAEHCAPTPVGQTVTVRAELEEVDGAKLVFRVSGHDGMDECLRGTHTRALIQRERFVKRLAAKQAAMANGTAAAP
ncbi:MAG TPA: hotdog domain-containing protein [Thermoleophilaceae bacterium]|nr:hotdog domain-containing protein [Thermoleophilaceae bacterium]